jgi:hypothetical protein
LFNQTFSFDLTSGGVGPGQGELSVGVGSAFSLSYIGSGADAFLFSVDGATATTTPVDYAELSAGIDISLAVSGALNSPSEAYTLTVSPFSGGSALYTQSGTFDSSTYNTSGFSYLDSNTTGNGYFNSLNITPEATPEPSAALLGISGLATLYLVRRRR